MTSASETTATPTADVRTIVGAGVKVGIATTVGVVVFALLSRVMGGATEMVVQSLLVLAGGAVFAYLPSFLFRPTDVDSIAWTAMIGLLGSLTFTVIDTVLLRPLDLYHWTWDAIGGGSGYWYIPVWWMGSTVLAWLGGWVVTNHGGRIDVPVAAGQTVGIGVLVSAILMVTGAVPVHSAGVALGFAIALILHVPLSAVLHKT